MSDRLSKEAHTRDIAINIANPQSAVSPAQNSVVSQERHPGEPTETNNAGAPGFLVAHASQRENANDAVTTFTRLNTGGPRHDSSMPRPISHTPSEWIHDSYGRFLAAEAGSARNERNKNLPAKLWRSIRDPVARRIEQHRREQRTRQNLPLPSFVVSQQSVPSFPDETLSSQQPDAGNESRQDTRTATTATPQLTSFASAQALLSGNVRSARTSTPMSQRGRFPSPVPTIVVSMGTFPPALSPAHPPRRQTIWSSISVIFYDGYKWLVEKFTYEVGTVTRIIYVIAGAATVSTIAAIIALSTKSGYSDGAVMAVRIWLGASAAVMLVVLLYNSHRNGRLAEWGPRRRRYEIEDGIVEHELQRMPQVPPPVHIPHQNDDGDLPQTVRDEIQRLRNDVDTLMHTRRGEVGNVRQDLYFGSQIGLTHPDRSQDSTIGIARSTSFYDHEQQQAHGGSEEGPRNIEPRRQHRRHIEADYNGESSHAAAAMALSGLEDDSITANEEMSSITAVHGHRSGYSRGSSNSSTIEYRYSSRLVSADADISAVSQSIENQGSHQEDNSQDQTAGSDADGVRVLRHRRSETLLSSSSVSTITSFEGGYVTRSMVERQGSWIRNSSLLAHSPPLHPDYPPAPASSPVSDCSTPTITAASPLDDLDQDLEMRLPSPADLTRNRHAYVLDYNRGFDDEFYGDGDHQVPRGLPARDWSSEFSDDDREYSDRSLSALPIRRFLGTGSGVVPRDFRDMTPIIEQSSDATNSSPNMR